MKAVSGVMASGVWRWREVSSDVRVMGRRTRAESDVRVRHSLLLRKEIQTADLYGRKVEPVAQEVAQTVAARSMM